MKITYRSLVRIGYSILPSSGKCSFTAQVGHSIADNLVVQFGTFVVAMVADRTVYVDAKVLSSFNCVNIGAKEDELPAVAMRTISKRMTILSAMNKKWSAPIFWAQTPSINKNKAAFRE